VLGTLAHEYQHLINASRRMFVNTTATDFEETWLNEGLSHIAEELLFYRVSGLTPRTNISASTIRASQAYIDAFNDYESDNFGRYREYLRRRRSSRPYSDNGFARDAGATWAFLARTPRPARRHRLATRGSGSPTRQRRAWRIFARCSDRRSQTVRDGRRRC
jgi:hypothetical protein